MYGSVFYSITPPAKDPSSPSTRLYTLKIPTRLGKDTTWNTRCPSGTQSPIHVGKDHHNGENDEKGPMGHGFTP
ncbi:hypothetical protein JOD24_002315 [Kroppenstedtia sanguinis]